MKGCSETFVAEEKKSASANASAMEREVESKGVIELCYLISNRIELLQPKLLL